MKIRLRKQKITLKNEKRKCQEKSAESKIFTKEIRFFLNFCVSTKSPRKPIQKQLMSLAIRIKTDGFLPCTFLSILLQHMIYDEIASAFSCGGVIENRFYIRWLCFINSSTFMSLYCLIQDDEKAQESLHTYVCRNSRHFWRKEKMNVCKRSSASLARRSYKRDKN